jgi:photoactive yellow protein
MRFDDPAARHVLDAFGQEELDALSFGVVRLNREGVVVAYNSAERAVSGLRAVHVLGHRFFEAVAPCMNNYLVAQRFLDEPELDASFVYVLTYRMKPTPVRLRLLQAASSPNGYVLIERTP